MRSPTSLYRLFDAKGNLLYIGVGGNPGRRFEQHRDDKAWWGDVASITLQHYVRREYALEAEKMAIQAERPFYNVTYNWDSGEEPVEDPSFDLAIESEPLRRRHWFVREGHSLLAAGDRRHLTRWAECQRLWTSARNLWASEWVMPMRYDDVEVAMVMVEFFRLRAAGFSESVGTFDRAMDVLLESVPGWGDVSRFGPTLDCEWDWDDEAGWHFARRQPPTVTAGGDDGGMPTEDKETE